MTTPDLEPGEGLPDFVVRMQNSIIQFTGCIDDALDDICSVGYTIGESYVPFDPDPDEGCKAVDVQCSQAWVRTSNVRVSPDGLDAAFGGAGCEVTLLMDIEVGVLRCIKIPKGGKAPKAMDVLVAGMQAMTDMQAILCAACNCAYDDGTDVWDRITIGQWTPTGPLGGQYGGVWTFTVELG